MMNPDNRIDALADAARSAVNKIAEVAHDAGKTAVAEIHQIATKVEEQVEYAEAKAAETLKLVE